ncbi:hypothetical protein D3C72_1381940 [compost metagenome]
MFKLGIGWNGVLKHQHHVRRINQFIADLDMDDLHVRDFSLHLVEMLSALGRLANKHWVEATILEDHLVGYIGFLTEGNDTDVESHTASYGIKPRGEPRSN